MCILCVYLQWVPAFEGMTEWGGGQGCHQRAEKAGQETGVRGWGYWQSLDRTELRA